MKNTSDIKFISGELIQESAEISFCTQINDIISQQVINTPVKLVKIDEFNKTDIKKYKKIFVYTHDIIPFLKKFYNNLENETTLITHNSDNGIDDRFLEILDSDKIKKWYTQNLYTKHSKLRSLPIGIANKQWTHGNQIVINKIKNINLPKKTLVYKNFNLHTNFEKRRYVDQVTSQNGIPMAGSKEYEKYLTDVADSFFVLCPPGNGVDCHRIWECLALGSIPVVEKNIAFEQFKHLPILFINDWKSVTLNFLEKNLSYTNKFSEHIPELYISYWNKIIK